MESTNCSSFLSRFAAYVHDQRDVIGRTWMRSVRESPDVTGAVHISEAALQDHVPQLMDDLVDLLCLEKESAGNAQSAEHSRLHGREQWKAGYNVSELIWEIYIIRRVLTQNVLGEFARQHPDFSAEDCSQAAALIHDFFHRVTCESVGQFVEEQQRAIKGAHEALQQTGDSRDRLTRTIAHELRNVLNALTLAIKLLGEEADERHRSETTAMCARMLSDMNHILSGLLDYSALVAGQAKLSLEAFSLRGLFQEIVGEWKPVAEEQGLIFESKCEPTLGDVVSDKLKIKQIAGNFLSNAIKYRKPKEGGYVGISFSASGKTSWKMVVVDTGIGIASEHMAALFGEFSRIRSTNAVTGTGLGLAICKEFTELLGGHVEVLSEERKGTRFEVTLPISQNGQESVVSPDMREAIANSGQPPFQFI